MTTLGDNLSPDRAPGSPSTTLGGIIMRFSARAQIHCHSPREGFP